MAKITKLPVISAKHIPLGAPYNGDQWEFKFASGYGASVIRHDGSHGGKTGLFELAVLDTFGNITYDTNITDDVLGWLSVDEVRQTLIQIANLH